ncbi:hypothetical protein BJX61DRAFT_544728 [Aspergillus egyptiacus]|nr:hypothetical protein BJX61DRAFT_544728 [Aspergillus egyptiacus]
MPPSPRATIDKLPDDIIVQQFVPGVDYSVVIIEFGNSPIALNPTIYEYPPEDANNPNRFLTFDIKFSPALKEHLIKRDDDPLLFDKLQELAVQAYKVNGMLGGFWDNVDIRVQPNGEPVVIEVNPMPAIFLPPEIQYEDPVISQSLPGGHRALLNILLANYFTRTGQESRRLQGIATTYDGVADVYDTAYLTKSTAEKVLTDVISRFDFSGSLLDLAAGTGVVGRIIRKCHKPTASSSRSANGSVNGGLCHDSHVTDATYHHVGVDISPDMARVCKESGYESCYVGPMQTVLPTIPDQFDHIFCYQAIHFVSSFELSLVLSRCFQLARKSVTIGIDEIPDEYNKKMTAFNPSMTSINHVHEMRKFGIPCGWTLALEERHFGWRSPNVGVDVYTTIFHYERA